MGDGSRDPDRGGAGRDAPAAGHVLLGGHIARQGPAIRASVAGVAVAEGARVGRGKAVRAGRRTSTATSASATAASHQAPTSITVTCGCTICGADFLSAFAENKVLEFLFNPYCETSAKRRRYSFGYRSRRAPFWREHRFGLPSRRLLRQRFPARRAASVFPLHRLATMRACWRQGAAALRAIVKTLLHPLTTLRASLDDRLAQQEVRQEPDPVGNEDHQQGPQQLD